MNLTISEQFNSVVNLDAELTAVPLTGLYLNECNSSITVDNLLSFLPRVDFTFLDYDSGTSYNKFTESRNKRDIVMFDGSIYQSLADLNEGNEPDSSPLNWLLTDINSLRIKTFYLGVEKRALTNLNLNKRFITNQYIYNLSDVLVGGSVKLLPSDYAAWVFEPKGSDYVTITINEIALQATTDTPQDLYVINQGRLIDTLTLNPNADGRMEFERLDYSFSVKGRCLFVFEAQDVITSSAVIDPLKFRGFTAYTAVGIGGTPADAQYSYSTVSNGLNFNLTVELTPDVFIENNLKLFGAYLQASWELDVLNLFLKNANQRVNSNVIQQLDKSQLIFETKDLEGFSVARNFKEQKAKALKLIERVFDTELIDDTEGFQVNVTTP